jgi:transcriptional regulator with XRE-family HTH domain
MKHTRAPVLEPRILGAWIRCLREAQHMSQDALAVASGLDVRTVQRTENGNAASLTTRRCLARGLGYDNSDIFDDPYFASNVHCMLEEIKTMNEKTLDGQHPEHIRVKVERVRNGETLGRFADITNAALLNADDDIPEEAKAAAAALFDCMRDLADLCDVAFHDKLGLNKELESMLRELEGLGTAAYAAYRSVKLTGETWADKTPLALRIGYLMVVPAQKELGAVFVPRRVQLG